MGKNSNESMHLDKSVIYLFIGAFLISAVTLAFRYTKYAPCEEVLFTVNSNTFRVGELIKFSDETEGAKSWKWEFGDSSEVKNLKSPLHDYKEAGDYQVKLIVNNICEQTKTITINEKLIIRDSTKYPVFSLPESIKVGQVLKVKDETQNADSWEWRFGDNASVDAKTKRAEYVYEEPGLRSVRLIVNGDEDYVSVKKINVLPLSNQKARITQIEQPRDKGWNIKKAPTNSEPVVEKEKELKKPTAAPYISDRNFIVKIEMIADEKIKPQELVDYFCGNINLPIVENGENSTFLVLCENIKGKNLKKLEVSLNRVKGSNCITTLTISYKKGWL